MVSQHCLHLALYLVESHFGDLVSRVCECLIKKGTLSFLELVQFSELDPIDKRRNSQLVKNSVLVLVQHNCIQAFSIPKPGVDGDVENVTLYMALLDNILHRLRFAKFLAIVNADLGEQCETLLEGLLQHGRLTFQQLVQRATTEKHKDSKNMRTSFNKLVHARYVERCPKSDPLIMPDDDDKSTQNKRSKVISKLSIEQKAMVAAALPDTERFAGIYDNNKSKMMPEHDPPAAVGQKRCHERSEAINDLEDTITENEVLWRVNYEKFVLCLKKKVCVEHVRSNFGNLAANVLEAMIESYHDASNNDMVTASMDAIFEGVRGKPGGISMTLDHVRTCLEQLGCSLCTDEIEALHTIGNKLLSVMYIINLSYVMYATVKIFLFGIDLKGMIEACRSAEIEDLVLKRHGRSAFRIYRMLAQKNFPVETDQVAEATVTDKAESRLLLYKLWKDEYLDMEKVTAGARDYDIFLWKVNKNVSQERFLDDLYRAALNLSQRSKFEQLQAKQPLSTEQEQKAATARHYILQSSLSKLDDSLMLFHDF